jgi:hypothetical protein
MAKDQENQVAQDDLKVLSEGQEPEAVQASCTTAASV